MWLSAAPSRWGVNSCFRNFEKSPPKAWASNLVLANLDEKKTKRFLLLLCCLYEVTPLHDYRQYV